MSNIETVIKKLLSDNIFYYVSDMTIEENVNDASFSNREINKIKRNGFKIYTQGSIPEDINSKHIEYIQVKSDNMIKVSDIRKTEILRLRICVDIILNKELETVYQQLSPNHPVMFRDERLARMQMLKTTSNIKELEKEWARYKYLVMEYSQEGYNELRSLFAHPEELTVDSFYRVIFRVFRDTPSKGSRINALQHVWGYFKNIATSKEQDYYFKELENYDEDKAIIIKNFLYDLSQKYDVQFLKNSYYFYN